MLNNNKQFDVWVKYVEADIFKMFTIPFASGNYHSFNDNPNVIIISKSLKTKMFGEEIAEGNFLDIKILEEGHGKENF